jgi:hypothetical protein
MNTKKDNSLKLNPLFFGAQSNNNLINTPNSKK